MDITGLTMCTEYNVSATARNFVGEESELSLPVTQATDTNDPEIPPKVTSVSIVPGSVTSLKVFWTFDGILDLSCDPAMNYNFEVGYFPVDKPRQLKTLLIEDESSSSFLIENLTTCTQYNVSMRVINFVGRGSPSSNSLLYVTSTDKPSDSPIITSLSQVQNTTEELQVEWKFNGVRKLNCPVNQNYSYVIYYEADDRSGEILTKEIEDKTLTSTKLTGLHSCSNYTVTITVINYAGVESNASTAVSQLTSTPNPSRVPTITDLSNVVNSTTQLKLAWQIPEPAWEWLKCDPTRYEYEYVIRYVNQDELGNSSRRRREADGFVKVPQDSREAVVSDLAPCTQYSISISVMNIAEKESDPAKASGLTFSEKPTVSPKILSLEAIGPTQLHLEWESMADIPSDALKCDPKFGFSYVIHYSSDEDEPVAVEVGSQETRLEITNLEPCVEYLVSIAIKNRAGVISDGNMRKNFTGAIPTGPVSSIQSEATPTIGIKVTWLPPHSHCNVTIYKIRYSLTFYDQCETRTPSWTNVTWTQNGTDDSPSLTIETVETFSTYQILIIPVTHGVIEGQVTNISVISHEDAPIGTLKLSLTNGRKRRAIAQWDELLCGERRGRVWYEYKFWLSEDEIPSEWQVTFKTVNVFSRLKRGASYNMTVRPVTLAGYGPESSQQITIPEGNLVLILVILAVIAVIFIILLLIMLYCKRRKRWKKYSVRRMSQPDVIAVIDEDDSDSGSEIIDEEMMNNMSVDPAGVYENHAFSISSMVIPAHHMNQPTTEDSSASQHGTLNPNEHGSRVEASRQENQMKNRNSNLVTYDNSRVILEKTNADPHSDYINATYISNCKREHFYIATQGPNSVTKGDFWRMVLQEDCNTIVMLCNLVENKRVTCNRYWPKKGTKNAMFGNMSIILKHEEARENFVIRELIVVDGKHTKRKVTQLHYTGWPEVGVPKTSRNLWQVIDLANKNMKHKKGKGPMVVHCSSGCGRTGTFIAMDAMIKEFEKTGKIDIFAFVDQMRKQRTSMVQEQGQYEFIFCAIFEKYFVGDGVLKCEGYSETLKTWQADGVLAKLYKMFDYLNPSSLNINSSGHNAINIAKNRYKDNIPRNDYRPYLLTEVPYDMESSDYINASFFNGYKDKDLFVATQDPLPTTLVDFWRLVWDYHCLTIVMLEQKDQYDSTTPPYWPMKGKSVFGPFTISILDKSRVLSHAITERHLSVTLKRQDENDRYSDDETREIKQICIKDWPRALHVPITPASLLAACEMVMKRHHHKPSSRILLHCRNGIGRSGIFIAVYNAIEEVKEKEETNLFTIVSELRKRRPMMVDSLARFTFCFEAIDHYLKEFDTYTNY
ncbi:putative receptor-type tyrosine-protein phosphatase kappa [Apostichopus japonicus]|uniref:protein-tyrosine-phosphatase n=1 Tax=Stichopus japonicus TaxID=307972 RepID=A0A2G8JPB2_STIJA|nr:putative receptor-type tyrosine-protein phosphatase kappa [Apostichopus japonicus]